MVKSAKAGAVLPLLTTALQDADAEVRDWEILFLEELTGDSYPQVYTSLAYHNASAFDQTLPRIFEHNTMGDHVGRPSRMLLLSSL